MLGVLFAFSMVLSSSKSLMSNLGSLGNLNNVVKSLRFVNLLLLLFGMGGKVF